MAVRPPGKDDLAAIARGYGMHLSDEDLGSFEPLVAGLLSSYDAVEELYARRRRSRTAANRTWKQPDPADNPLGAWYVTTEIAEQPDGPLAGRPVAIKDNIEVAGVPMMNGSATLEGFVPSRDATVVTRLLAAGATIAGKAVCEDLCFSGGSHTSRTGPVRNPWDTTRSAGGSSSGSAALVASGDVDLALGGDQGGSVRIPSACCGTVGHKPTHGLVPYTGAFPIELTIDHLGPITRTVADAALVLGVLAGPDGLDPRQPTDLRPEDYVAAARPDVDRAAGRRGRARGSGFPTCPQPGVDDAVRAAIDQLARGGLHGSRTSVPWHRDAMHVWNVIATEGATAQMVDGNAYGMNYRALRPGADRLLRTPVARAGHAWFSETVKLVVLGGRYAIDTGLRRSTTRWPATSPSSCAAVRRGAGRPRRAGHADPADDRHGPSPRPTHPRGVRRPSAGDDRQHRAVRRHAGTRPSVPAGLVDGLPAGLMIVGRHFDDGTCLRVAHAFERLSAASRPRPARRNVWPSRG